MSAQATLLKSLGLVVALSIPALAGCASAPARDLRAALTKPCADAKDAYPWLITDSWADGDQYLPDAQFRADGVMLYAYGGSEFDNGKWTLDGASLLIETNNHYADYSAAFDGASASGAMKNEAENEGTWTLTRSCES